VDKTTKFRIECAENVSGLPLARLALIPFHAVTLYAFRLDTGFHGIVEIIINFHPKFTCNRYFSPLLFLEWRRGNGLAQLKIQMSIWRKYEHILPNVQSASCVSHDVENGHTHVCSRILFGAHEKLKLQGCTTMCSSVLFYSHIGKYV